MLEVGGEGRSVVVLLCVVMIVSVIVYGGVDTGMLALLSAVSAGILLIWGWSAWRSGRLSINLSRLQLPMIGLVAIGLVQLLPLRDPGISPGVLGFPPAASLSLDPYATRFFLARLVLYLVFFAAALTFVNTERRLKSVASVVVIFGPLIAFFGILQWLERPESIYGLRPSPHAIPFGPYVNQHHFAALMEMTIGVALGLLFGGGLKSNRRLFLILAVVVMAMAVVLTGSRGGMISLLGVAGFSLAASLLARRRDETPRSASAVIDGFSGRLSAVAGGTAIVLLVAGMAVYLGGGESLLRGVGLQNSAADPTSGRSHFWQIGLKIFLDHPLLGAGLDAFGAAFTRYDTASGLLRVEQAHNDYLQILCDAGAIGFVCVAAYLYLLFSSGFRVISGRGSALRRSVAIGALAGCFGIAIHSFFDFPLRTPANAYFFLMLSALATVQVAERRESSRRRERQQKQHHRTSRVAA